MGTVMNCDLFNYYQYPFQSMEKGYSKISHAVIVFNS